MDETARPAPAHSRHRSETIGFTISGNGCELATHWDESDPFGAVLTCPCPLCDW